MGTRQPSNYNSRKINQNSGFEKGLKKDDWAFDPINLKEGLNAQLLAQNFVKKNQAFPNFYTSNPKAKKKQKLMNLGIDMGLVCIVIIGQ
ncbi:hypothetical protein P872_14040 [Rhodonellum psychrophilum GCM71 = DSM 17998]|uniref:Uncharacterized protein n=1 Tax=Rhodonellum psychrophilum GCM71 = DSM 17998 TaxID=1123057 RepID=U5BIE0_9BACT|nr:MULTISPECIES: hypothetical protein [Rhodonellum]ERM80180.1 hypothetical protein P872_14040 [Rhodonellum psychrophilum GCM71 = DSM 17998]